MQQTGIRVSDGAQLKRLAASVINQAVRDTGKRQFLARLQAFMWITGPELEIWADFADTTLDPYKLLPRLREARRKYK